jgi:hypothetical protein
MARLPSTLLSFAEQSLGPCVLVTALAGGEHDERVERIRDARGREYFAKRHPSAEKHRREVHAYRHWAPALGACAARLVATDPKTMAILVTALPGNPCQGADDVRAHRQAGAVLRLLHDAEPPRPLDGFQQWLTTRVSWWREQSAPLLSAGEKQAIDHHLAALHMLGTPNGGPCHLDYQPRNWLIDQAGTLRVIDFEHARIGLQTRDFARLHFRFWPSRPDLHEAFFDGYGRCLTETEQQTVCHCGAIDALTALVRGTQTGDAAMVAHGRTTVQQLQDGRGDA